MGEEVKIDIIRSTQNSLSKYIKKPPLTEKLLRKPPFKYLHDITTAVMKETGYLQGLYTQEELNPENIKDREAKIAFLDKLIAAVNLSTGISISARPNKIVAGLDVAKTNELLQVIGKALDKKIDSSKAVEQVLTKKSKGTSQQKKDGAKDKIAKETKVADTKSRDTRNSDTLKKKNKDKLKNLEKPESRKGKPKNVSPSKLQPANSKESIKEERELESRPDEENDYQLPSQVTEESSGLETVQLPNPEHKHDVKPPPPSPAVGLENPERGDNKDEVKEGNKERKTKDKTNVKTKGLDTNKDPVKEHDELNSTDNVKDDPSKSGEELKRPQSARAVHRKKAPRKSIISETASNEELPLPEKKIAEPKELSSLEKKPLEENTSQSSSENTSSGVVARESKRPRTAARPTSARPGAPRVRDRGTIQLIERDNKEVNEPVNVIVDSNDLTKEDDETLVIVEASSTEGVLDQVGDSQLLSGDQGHLVSQILETQKELEENVISETGLETVPKVDISWSSGRQEAVSREIDKLRSAIQALTRAVNPLGKLIDFLQEDVDSMQTELESWATTNQQLGQQLLAEQSQERERGTPLSGPIVQEKAIQLNTLLKGETTFTASTGWFDRWKKRHGIRQLTITGEQLSSDHAAAQEYLGTFETLITEENYSPRQVYNANETGLNFRALPTKNLASKEETRAPGFKMSKDRVTLMACSNAAGNHKLPLMMIGKAAKPRAFKHINMKSLPVFYRNKKKGWMDGKLFKEWFHDQFVPSVKKFSKDNDRPPRALLLIDNAPSHPDTEELSCGEIKAAFLPPNVTPLLQPMDQGVLKALKLKYRKQFLRSLIEDDTIPLVQKIKQTNVKDVVYWSAESWENVTVGAIRKSWKKLWTSLEFDDNATENDTANLIPLIQTIPGCEDAVEADVNEWMAADAASAAETLTDDDIIATVTQVQCEEEGSDDEPQPGCAGGEEKVSHNEAAAALDLALRYLEQQTTATPISDVHEEMAELRGKK